LLLLSLIGAARIPIQIPRFFDVTPGCLAGIYAAASRATLGVLERGRVVTAPRGRKIKLLEQRRACHCQASS